MERNKALPFLFLFSLATMGMVSFATASHSAPSLVWNLTVQKADYEAGEHYEGYTAQVRLISITWRDDVYNVTLGVHVGDRNFKRSFMVNGYSNEFLLENKSVFFFIYWPGFSNLSKVKFYQSGKKIKVVFVNKNIWKLMNESTGKVYSLSLGPSLETSLSFTVKQCSGFTIENHTCYDPKTENISGWMTFKGPFPLYISDWVYPSDPFGLIKGPVIISGRIELNMSTYRYLKSFRYPSSEPWYLRNAYWLFPLIAVAGLGGAVVLRRR